METNATAHDRNTRRHTELAGMTTSQLESLERRAGWEPTQNRDAAAALRSNTHPLAQHLDAAGREAAATSLEQAARQCEADAATATEILENRSKQAGRWSYDQHGNRVARLA